MKPVRYSKRQEVLAKYSKDSWCNVRMRVVKDNGKFSLNAAYIELHGGLAAVPSLKQSKIPGKNFMNNDTRCRIQLMDEMFYKSASNFPEIITFGDRRVGVLMVCASRKVRFDPDNCLSTVCDWLEPRTKKVGKQSRDRGWGIGLVNNDSQIVGQAYRDTDLGMNLSHTLIIIKQWSDVQEPLMSSMKEIFITDQTWV